MKLNRYLTAIAFVLAVFTSYGQSRTPVVWSFNTERLSKHEIILTLTADVAAGWHVYSQYSGKDGPQPTRVIFNTGEAYAPIGRPEEKGRATTYYDSIYEMKITWFAGRVSFLQKLKLNEPVTRISGRIEYMVCNNQMCVPDKREFAVEIEQRF
jgi:DsbC/DsbD-like thiol-disulfide interchange protein